MLADDTVLFANSLDELQTTLNSLHEYVRNTPLNLTVNTDKTKTSVFRKGGSIDIPVHTRMNFCKTLIWFLQLFSIVFGIITAN